MNFKSTTESTLSLYPFLPSIILGLTSVQYNFIVLHL
nr:MAG TPA: hypothetical protein [Caudoviricetes sp.]